MPIDVREQTDYATGGDQDLQLLIDGIPGFVYTMTPAGAPERYNRPLLEYFGKPLEVLKDWVSADVVHPDDLPQAVGAWKNGLASGDRYEVELRLHAANGEYRWFHLRSEPLRGQEGHILRWYGLVTDIEASKRLEARLRASEQGFRSIVDSVPGLVYTATPAGEIEYVNQQTIEYFDRTLEELRNWAMIDAVHPNDLPRVIASWKHAVESGDEHNIEQRLLGADGVHRWFHGRSLPVKDAEGRVVRWYGLLTNIDNEKRAERRLRRALRARFEAALAERTRIARDMHDGLLQEIAGIALQLGTVIPHVRKAPEDSATKLEGILALVQRANRRAREAVGGMRELSKAIDLVSAVQDEAQRLTTEAALTVSLSVKGPVCVVPVAIGETAIAIVHEALMNVVKHANARGVKINLTFGRASLRLSVIDNGQGLPHRSNTNDRKDRYGIVGMRERAARIGGSLRLCSVPAKGTSVRFDVPLINSETLRA